jgi:hypothetical protein
MKAAKNIKALAVTFRGIMLLVVFAAIVFTITAIIQETAGLHLMAKQSRKTDTRTELTAQQKHDKIVRGANRLWLADGTMHLVYSLPTTFIPITGRQVEIYDTDINLLWSGSEKEKPFTYLSGLENYRVIDRYHAMHSEFLIDFSRSLVVPVVSPDKTRIENWRYVPSGQFFAGYNARGEIIGYLGAEGFSTDREKVGSLGGFSRAAAWAPRDSYTPRLLWQSEKVLWQIDFERRQAEKLCESKEGILYMHLFGWRALEEQETSLRGAILVYEKGGCHIVFDNPRQVIKINLPAVYSQINHYVRLLREENSFYVQVSGSKGAPVDTSDRAAVVKWIEETRGKPRDIWNELHRLEENGNLKLLSRNDWTRPPQVRETGKTYWQKIQEFKKYTTAFSPIAFRPIVGLHAKLMEDPDIDHGNNFVEFLDAVTTYFVPVNIFYCLVVSLLSVCAAVYHGLGRRRSLAGLVGWLVFVGVFNVAGLLTYLAMNHRPVLKCSTCGKKRHLMGDICIRCGSGLPVPERRQTDLVFAG